MDKQYVYELTGGRAPINGEEADLINYGTYASSKLALDAGEDRFVISQQEVLMEVRHL